MAYQNVSTPRFFIDHLQYYRAIGLAVGGYDHIWNVDAVANAGTQKKTMGLVGLNPSYDLRFLGSDLISATTGWNINNHLDESFPVHELNCIGLLGHNLGSTASSSTSFGYAYSAVDAAGVTQYPYAQCTNDIKINCTGTGTSVHAIHDGFSFSSTSGTTASSLDLNSWGGCVVRSLAGSDLTSTYEHRMGSQFWGRTYDMPHSTDLDLTMSIEMDSVKNIKTRGGASLTSAAYTKPPNWGDGGAWQMGGQPNLRNGRRAWDLSFSYLAPNDIMPDIAGTEIAYGEENELTNIFLNTDFFSQVWNRTMGGHLPFIFQPDGSNNNQDQFAICRFDMNSLEYEQIAPNLYKINLKIRESW